MTKGFTLSLLFSALWAPLLFSQIIGSQKNGQSLPAEVKASEVDAGGFSGNVNLFSGTYNASYPLGTVSTPTGLSFTATLSYGSSFTSGDNLPHTSGIPYGEGWNLDMPSISVSSEDYNKYTLWESWQFSQGSDFPNGDNNVYTQEYDLAEAGREGDIYWFAPTLNIPGVAGGRIVYKYYDNNLHYFTLHTFDRYVEATFDGGQWEVVLDDGTRYQLIPAVVSYRTPSNQRVQGAAFEGTGDPECGEGKGGGALDNLALPKMEVLTWYCSKITNRNLIGAIHFKYETFGALDFNKVFTEQGLMWENISKQWVNPNTNIIARRPEKVYRDIVLKEVDSGFERLLLEHASIPTAAGDNMLDISDTEDVFRIDSMYSRSLVYSATTDGFGSWYRYRHAMSQGFSEPLAFPSQTNPYVFSPFTGQPFLKREAVGSSGTPAFDHSYLESPRLDKIGVDIVPGDIYEVTTSIATGCTSGTPPSEGCLFDINLATGFNDLEYDLGQGKIDAENYGKATGQQVFSTFNQAVKWFTHGSGNLGNDFLSTSNFFVMPNLPDKYDGFHIQVGPANSDNDFSMKPCSIVMAPGGGSPGRPITCSSYFKEANDGTPDDPVTGASPFRSGDNIPHNFGIGVPWWMLNEFYSYCEGAVQLLHLPAAATHNDPHLHGFLVVRWPR